VTELPCHVTLLSGSQLSDENKKKAVIYVLDRYQVSLKAYHELTQLTDQLPRTYTLEDAQKLLNDSYYINATPGEDSGAQTPLLYELRKDSRLRNYEDSKLLVSITYKITLIVKNTHPLLFINSPNPPYMLNISPTIFYCFEVSEEYFLFHLR